MSFPKISVIVPVYNIESCLKNCVDSILAQTYQNIEVILIDDGSTDSSSDICDAYAKLDDRIIVFHQPNKGQAVARNRGTEQATGNYITFIDGDDYIHPDFLRCLLDNIENYRAQIAICNMKKVKTISKKHFSKIKGNTCLFNREDSLSSMLYQKDFDVDVGGKLYRSEHIKSYPFPEGKLYEDIPTVVRAVASAEQVVLIPEKLYYYYQRPNSTVHKRTFQSIRDEIEMTDEMYSFIVKEFPRVEAAALCKKFSNYCQVLREISRYPANEIVQEGVLQFLRGNASRVRKDPKARLKNRFAAALIEINPELIERLG